MFPISNIFGLIFQKVLAGIIVILLGVIVYQYWSFNKELKICQNELKTEKDKVVKLTEVTSNIRSDYQKTINEKNKIEAELKVLGDRVSDYLISEYEKHKKDLDAYKNQVLVDNLPLNVNNDINETTESIKNIDVLQTMYFKVKR